MSKKTISEFCIYAIRHTEVLDDTFLDEGGKGTFEENKRWVNGSNLFLRAKREKKDMPVIFGRAEVDSELLYYAMLESVDVDDEAKKTIYSFSGMRELEEPLPLQ